MNTSRPDHPLKKFRTGLNLTLRQMAAETGTSAAALSRIETYKQDPDLGLLRQVAALADRRNVTLDMGVFLSVRPTPKAKAEARAQ